MKKRNLPSLNALRAFEAAGRTGRMMHAAEELHVTHGAVSRQVRSLETDLGVALFTGPKNNLSLSPAGAELLSCLTSAFDQIDAGIRSVSNEKEGVLDVSCLGTFMMRWLIPRLHKFNDLHPEIDVRFSASSADVDFGRDRVDVAIRVGSDPWPESATLVRLFPDYVGPVLSQKLAARLNLERPDDLLELRVLQSRSRPGLWHHWCSMAGLRGERLDRVEEYEHLYFMLEGVLSGLGVGVAPWSAVVDDVNAGRLVAPFAFQPSGKHYAALLPGNASRKAEIFCDWLKAEAEMSPSVPPAGAQPPG